MFMWRSLSPSKIVACMDYCLSQRENGTRVNGNGTYQANGETPPAGESRADEGPVDQAAAEIQSRL